MHQDSPLGKATDYPQIYEPGLLCPISRADAREALGIAEKQPFTGVDIWNAWELTWLGPGRRPEVATAAIRVAADTPNLIESKSLKLYLNSLAMTEFASGRKVEETVARDLQKAVGGPVAVRLTPVSRSESGAVSRLPGYCLDQLDVSCEDWEVRPDYLQADTGVTIREDLYSHLLRSLCPVTGQPDIGSVHISYCGPRIDHEGLLQYVVSYRQHNDFHEACVERIYVDILERCGPADLTVAAFYQRRGGIDINPFRSNFEQPPGRLRLWRQ